MEEPPKEEIKLYFNCALCCKEKPSDQSMREFSRINVGWTEKGFQVWCVRHDCEIVHYEGEE